MGGKGLKVTEADARYLFSALVAVLVGIAGVILENLIVRVAVGCWLGTKRVNMDCVNRIGFPMLFVPLLPAFAAGLGTLFYLRPTKANEE